MEGILFETQEQVIYEAIEKMNSDNKRGIILNLGTGSGKTFIALHMAYFMEPIKLLIVAPASKVREGGWDESISFLNKKLGWDFNYEVVSYNKLPTNIDKGTYIIFDECHYLKNPTTKRGKSAINLIKKAYGFVGLSATPMANGWNDFASYMIWFGHVPNKTRFINDYSTGLDKFYKPIGWKRTLELADKWNKMSVSRKKEEMTDLPDMVEVNVEFKREADYNKIIKFRYLNDVVYDSNPKLMVGLRTHGNVKDKQNWTKEFLESTNDNVVIFYNFNVEREKILEIIPKDKKVYTVWGGQFDLPKKSEWDKVTNSVTLVQIQAGGTGIELQYANLVIYYSPTYSFQDFDQSLGRAWRTGQKRKVTVYKFKTKGTVETDIWRALTNKQDFNESLYLEDI